MNFSYTTQLEWISSKAGISPVTTRGNSGAHVSKLEILSTYVEHLKRIQEEYSSKDSSRQEWLAEIRTFRNIWLDNEELLFRLSEPKFSEPVVQQPDETPIAVPGPPRGMPSPLTLGLRGATSTRPAQSRLLKSETNTSITPSQSSSRKQQSNPPRFSREGGDDLFGLGESLRSQDTGAYYRKNRPGLPDPPPNAVRFTHTQCYPKLNGPAKQYFHEFKSNFPDLALSLHRPAHPEVKWGGPVDIEVNLRPGRGEGRSSHRLNIAAKEAALAGLREYAFRCGPGYEFEPINQYYQKNRKSFHPLSDRESQEIEIDRMIKEESGVSATSRRASAAVKEPEDRDARGTAKRRGGEAAGRRERSTSRRQPLRRFTRQSTDRWTPY